MIDRQAARRVLEGNDRGGFTVPAAGLYPYQWLWDSAFAALGWAHVSEERAWQELQSLLAAQWESGMIPHIVFHGRESTYFPGPSVWGVTTNPPSTGITQPPVLATVVRALYERSRDRALARRVVQAMLPRLAAYHRWLYQARDPEGTGLVAILHPWESGMDNSPAWDEPLAQVPAERASWVMGERKDLLHVGREQRPTDDEYRRYIALVVAFREAGYDPGRLYAESPFCVADVGFNALLHRANHDLAALASDPGFEDDESCAVMQELERQSELQSRAFDGLWNEEAGLYASLDRRSGRALVVPTSAGLLPLFAGLPDRRRAERMAATLMHWGEAVRYLVPSTAPSSAYFEPRRYWRGPVWVHVNWMVWAGLRRYGFAELAERVRRDTFTLVERSGFREYYDPLTGSGLGGQGFSWSAALSLAWEADGSPPGAAGGSCGSA